jgi:HSP20 family protein
MADRNTEQGTSRDQGGARQAGAAQQSTTGQQRSSTQAGAGAERERGIQTGREVGRPRRGATGLQRRGGAVTPYGGAAATPFGMMRRMMDDMDRLFENVAFGGTSALSPLGAFDALDELSRLPALPQAATVWTPAIEVFERGNEYVVRADLPGLRREDVNVEVDNGVLTISGERRSEYEDESPEGFYRSERVYGVFSRSIPLPEGVKEDQVKATFQDGVVEVTVPKPEEAQSRRKRIDIK